MKVSGRGRTTAREGGSGCDRAEQQRARRGLPACFARACGASRLRLAVGADRRLPYGVWSAQAGSIPNGGRAADERPARNAARPPAVRLPCPRDGPDQQPQAGPPARGQQQPGPCQAQQPLRELPARIACPARRVGFARRNEPPELGPDPLRTCSCPCCLRATLAPSTLALRPVHWTPGLPGFRAGRQRPAPSRPPCPARHSVSVRARASTRYRIGVGLRVFAPLNEASQPRSRPTVARARHRRRRPPAANPLARLSATGPCRLLVLPAGALDDRTPRVSPARLVRSSRVPPKARQGSGPSWPGHNLSLGVSLRLADEMPAGPALFGSGCGPS